MNEAKFLSDAAAGAIPEETPNIIGWAEANVQFPSSARSRYFKISVAPWLRLPLTCVAHDNSVRLMTLVKPVQSGGSVLGEVLMLFWMKYGRGFIQYNWSNDKRADDRWESRVSGIINSCAPIAKIIASLPTYEATKGEIDFGRVFFRMQGAFVPDNLDSDSIPIQINEEVHAWEPGHLQKARNRQTAVWNSKGIDISNAGKKGDQLHQAFVNGTQEHWEVKCPGCHEYHAMRTRWEDAHPLLGGLRYDSEQSRHDDGSMDWERIRSSLRYQMPCGFIVHDDPLERRALSTAGRYGKPQNPGADKSHRSFTYQGVVVDYISWLQLVKEKGDALRARRLGDPEPWRRYLTERECLFYDPDDVPIVGQVRLSKSLKKNRDGLPDPKLRLFAIDRQQGQVARGEFPHWWMVIRDFAIVKDSLQSLLVWEGKIETDDGVIATLKEHNCQVWQGVADSGDDTTHVYTFCLRNGINAIKGGAEQWYPHPPNGHRRIFSVEKPLHKMINRDPVYPYIDTADGQVPDPREPLFWLYSKAGIRERLHWLRAETTWDTPGDVSEDYHKHMEAEERVSRRHPRTGEEITEFVQQKSRNDLYVCECYIAMQVEQAGLVREQPPLPST